MRKVPPGTRIISVKQSEFDFKDFMAAIPLSAAILLAGFH
jgi:hypothetical protein